MRTFIISALVLSALLCQCDASSGLKASFSQSGAANLLSAVLPSIEKGVTAFKIPDISVVVASINVSISEFQCEGFAIGDAVVEFPPGVGAGLVLNGIDLSCGGAWSFFQVDIHVPSGSGSFNVSLGAASADLSVLVTMGQNGNPVLNATAATLNVTSANITFEGSSWDWLLDLLRSLITNALQNDLGAILTAVIDEVVNVLVNKVLASLQYALPLPLPGPYDILELRFGLAEQPVFNTTYLGLGLQGDVVPVFAPVTPPLTPPSLPAFDSSFATTDIQLYLSSYTAVSAVYSLFTADLLTWLLPPSSLPFGFNTTQAYSLVAPNLPKMFPDSQMYIYVVVAGMPEFTIQPSGISAGLPLLLGFNVNTSTWGNDTFNAFVLETNVSASIDLSLDSGNGTSTFYAKINYANASSAVETSNVGDVSVGLLTGLLNFVFDVVLIPLVNDLISGGISFPTTNGTGLVNPSISLGSGYIGITTNFTIAL